MNIFGKVTRRTLGKNKVRTIVTIIGIILSASMITAVTTSIASFQKYLLDCAIYREGDWHIWLEGVPKEETDGMLAEDGVKSGFFAQELGYADIGSSNADKPYLYVLGADELFLEKMPVHLTGGRMPENSEEILLPQHLAENGGVAYVLGDKLTLELGERYWDGERLSQFNSFYGEDEMSEGEELRIREKRSYTVVGFYERPNFENFSAPGYTAITLWDDSRPSESVSAFFRMENPRDAYLEEAPYGRVTNDDVLRYEGASKYGRFYEILYNLAAILIALIMFGSISLIYNAFSISVSERTKEFGLLSSVGATKRQIRRMVFLEALYVSCIGIPLGILAGVGGIGVTFYFLEDKFPSFNGVDEVALKLHVSPLAILAAALLAFVTVLISAWVPSRRAKRVTAIEAIRQSGDLNLRAKEVKTSKLAYRMFGLEGMLGQKNFKRSRKRYRATIFSLFMSVVLFISASSFCTYMVDSMNGVFLQYDYDISYQWWDSGRALDGTQMYLNQVQEALEHTEGVTQCSGIRRKDKSIRLEPDWLPKETKEKYEEAGYHMDELETQIRLFGVDDATYRAFLKENGLQAEAYYDAEHPLAVALAQDSMFNGTTEKVEKTILLDDSVTEIRLQLQDVEKWQALYQGAEKENLSEEEWEDLNEKSRYEFTAEIGAYVDSLPFGLDSSYTYGIYLLYPVEVYDSFMRDDSHNAIYFKATDHEAAYESLTKAAAENKLPADNFYDVYETNEDEKNLLTVIEVFAYGFIVLISLISVANVFNTISTNILLQRREFAMLRSVGMTSSGLKRMLDYQCVLYGAKALAFGIPVAFGVTYWIFRTVSSGYDTSFYLPWQAVAIAVGSVFAVVFSTMLYTMGKIGKDNLIDALRNENL